MGGELRLLAVLGWTVACFVEDEIPGAFGAPLARSRGDDRCLLEGGPESGPCGRWEGQ